MRKEQNYKWNMLSLGTCYYPEHWDRSLWEEDLERMLDAGIGTVRVAEFAWSKFEPTEGNFTYAFFDDFLEAALKCGMKVIFSTPSATPPAWLTEKYPEVLNAKMDGLSSVQIKIRTQHSLLMHHKWEQWKKPRSNVKI